FFFRAEDVIRCFHVTGVQTCALPISTSAMVSPAPISSAVLALRSEKICRARLTAAKATETGLEPMAVSVRTCLAVLKVLWNRREIGRASCRAIVELWSVRGAFDK